MTVTADDVRKRMEQMEATGEDVPPLSDEQAQDIAAILATPVAPVDSD